MLTVYERIKSLAHKHLRRLHGYNKISDFTEVTPEIIASKESLGVYVNRDETRIFFTIKGLFIEAESFFIDYGDVKEVSINLDEVSKNDAETMTITLFNNSSLALNILQPQFIQNSGKRTQEVWSVYSFLRNIVSK